MNAGDTIVTLDSSVLSDELTTAQDTYSLEETKTNKTVADAKDSIADAQDAYTEGSKEQAALVSDALSSYNEAKQTEEEQKSAYEKAQEQTKKAKQAYEELKEQKSTLQKALKTAKNQTHATDGYSQLTVVSATGTDTETFLEETENFFNRYYSRNEYYEVSVTSMESMLSSMTSMLTTVSLAIAVIAGISLLVGGIGVMNIMLVSITERTREIGTRKALGATNGSIRLQFIMESVVICLLGGAIGIILGLTLGSIATKMLGYAAKASVASIVFSVVFSIFIGVFFGYYPANKAAKLNPIEALRYE